MTCLYCCFAALAKADGAEIVAAEELPGGVLNEAPGSADGVTLCEIAGGVASAAGAVACACAGPLLGGLGLAAGGDWLRALMASRDRNRSATKLATTLTLLNIHCTPSRKTISPRRLPSNENGSDRS